MFVLLQGAVGRILSPSPPSPTLPLALALSPPASVGVAGGDRSSPSLARLCQGCCRSRFSPGLCPLLRTDALPMPGRHRDAPRAHTPQGRLCTPPSPSLHHHEAPSRCYH